jgi:hypothetical protein
LIQNLASDLRVVVANAAKSNGTLLGLAAKSIVMGAPSELGPIEPLVQGIPCSILIQPQIAAQNFPLHKCGEFALQQSRTLAKKLLTNGMMMGESPATIDDVVAKLSSRDVYFSHGSVIDHVEAAALGLKVEYLKPEDPIWQRIWLLFCMYEHDCRRARYLKVFEGATRSCYFTTDTAGVDDPSSGCRKSASYARAALRAVSLSPNGVAPQLNAGFFFCGVDQRDLPTMFAIRSTRR